MRTLLAFALFALVACGEIRQVERLSVATDTIQAAHPGQTLLEVEVRESLPNVFGAADIFGRTRPHSVLSVSYLGLHEGNPVFEQSRTRLLSDATTMNSSPIIIPQTTTTSHSGTVTGSTFGSYGTNYSTFGYQGTSTTTAPPIVLPPSGNTTTVLAPTARQFKVNLDKTDSIRVSGHMISELRLEGQILSYVVRQLTSE